MKVENQQLQQTLNAAQEALQKAQQELDRALSDIENTHQVPEQSQCIENMPSILH